MSHFGILLGMRIDCNLRQLLVVAAACGLAGAASGADPTVEQALRAGKGVLVLQVGSDWCVSGEDVRKTFESDAFRRAVGSK